ncbi:hypothetical protein FRB95_002308 [Tulasnella sp. JGI-2019a]|nr:hypothetical protein FRB95_002308 [Tulasnella sp. JGI-2019a]
MFIVLFSLFGLTHLGQAIYYRIWWLVPTVVLCAFAELLGWAGRYWSSQNYRALTPFLMQICCTIMAPFMAAGMFFILGMITNRVGQEYSRLRPKVFSIISNSFDIFSLVIQAIGAALHEMNKYHGDRIVAISLAVIVAVEFLVRYLWDKPLRARITPERTLMGHNEKLLLSGLAIATMWLYIRCANFTLRKDRGCNSSDPPLFRGPKPSIERSSY